MPDLRLAATQALEALVDARVRPPHKQDSSKYDAAITALRAALAEQPAEQEPVAWWHRKSNTFTSGNLVSNFAEWAPLYTAPQPAKPAEQEPVAWEWRWFDTSPYTVSSGQWSEWKRVEPRNSLCTLDDALNEFRAYIANGLRYELRAIYTAPQPAIPPGYKLVPIQKLVELKASIHGDCFRGTDWELETISTMLAAAPEAPQPAKPAEQEPVAWCDQYEDHIDGLRHYSDGGAREIPLYTAPNLVRAQALEEAAGVTGEFAQKWWSMHCASNKHMDTTRKAHDDFCALQAAIRKLKDKT